MLINLIDTYRQRLELLPARLVSLAIVCYLVTRERLVVLLSARRMENLLGAKAQLVGTGGVSEKMFNQ